MGASSGKKNLKDIGKLGYLKSNYMIEEIFYFLNIKQKLDIIKYNKKLQKKFGIGIGEYKKISVKYILFEKNGKGNEYELYTSKLIYRGGYLNGKRCGFGREYYDSGYIKFEGEYLNGKKWN